MAKHFTLDIKLGNAEMQTGYDVAYALREIADRIDLRIGDDMPNTQQGGPIYDLNGNMVGKWEVVGK